MLFGYARVSTADQNLDLQINSLLEAGIQKSNIYVDKISGRTQSRPELDALLNYLRKGDTLYVWKLDRIARSLIHLTQLINHFREKEIGFKSITEPFIDTTVDSPQGSFLLNIFGSLAEFERDLIVERTKAGLANAKQRGKKLGRREGLTKSGLKKANRVKLLVDNGHYTVDEICEEVGISKGTYYKYLKINNIKTRGYNSNPKKV